MVSDIAAVSHVRGLVLGGPRVLHSRTFYETVWGLTAIAEQDGITYFRGGGPEHHILALKTAPEICLIALEMAAANASAVTNLHRKVTELGLKVRTPPHLLSTPGGGFGFEMRDIEDRLIRISSDVEPADSANSPTKPNKVSHIVLNSTDIERAQQFYCDVLGFTVSDRSEDQMVFIRCNNSHHNIAFNRSPFTSLNHVSFEMLTFDAVMKGVGRLAAAGVPTAWGPGCHGVGHIMFAYFIDPNGFVIEYNYYVQPFDPQRHQPKVHPRSRDNMDYWGTAGMPNAEIRAAMAGKSMTPPIT